MQVVFGNLEVCSYGNGLIMESAEWITPSQSQHHHRLKVGIHSSTEISLLHQWLVNQTSPSPTPLALIVDLLPPSPFFPKQASMFGVTAYPFHQLACCLHHRHHHPSGNLPHLPLRNFTVRADDAVPGNLVTLQEFQRSANHPRIRL